MAWLSWIMSNVILASLLALAACFVQRLGRYAVARFLWLLALVKLVTPPLVSVPLVELPGTMACALGVCKCEHHGTLASMTGTLPWVLFAVWLAGASVICWTSWRRWARFRELISFGLPVSREWIALAAQLSGELSLRRPPEILAVPGRLPPLVVPGWRRPRLLMPLALMDQLNARQRKALLLHELVHVKRGDHLVRMLELAVGVVFWWLPIVGLIGRQLRACEEACCDAAVVARLPQARRDYARLLLDVLDFANPLPARAVPHATAMSAVNHLEHRLHAILDGPQGTQRAWPAIALVMGLACVILPCELRYDFARRGFEAQPASKMNSDGCNPGSAATSLPSVGLEQETFAVFCCPL